MAFVALEPCLKINEFSVAPRGMPELREHTSVRVTGLFLMAGLIPGGTTELMEHTSVEVTDLIQGARKTTFI